MLAWHTQPWEALLELVRHAEEAGIEAVYVDGDVSMLPSRGDADVLDGYTVMTALLASTERIGVGSIRLPHHWNAAKLAQAVATQERLFPGRPRLLTSIGGQPMDRHFGLPWGSADQRAARLDETLDAARALWRGETVTREGRYVRLDGAQVRPIPPPGRPVVEVASGVSSRLALVVRHADRWDMNLPPTPDRVKNALAAVHRACEEQGRPIESLGTQTWVLTRPLGEERPEALLAAFRRWHPWFAAIPDEEARRAVVAGPPERCRERLAELHALGVDLLLADLTGLDLDATHQAIDAIRP